MCCHLIKLGGDDGTLSQRRQSYDNESWPSDGSIRGGEVGDDLENIWTSHTHHPR